MQAECQAVRVLGQIDRGADAVPGNILPPESAPAQRGMIFPERNHLLEEPENVLVGSELTPIQPSNFVILVIGIVVAKLGIQELVPGAKHRRTVGQEEQTAEILYLLAGAMRGLAGETAFIPFLPTIPTVVRVGTVLIIISVLPIVLAVIGDEIVEGEAVVGRHIIHTLIRVISVGAAVWKQIIAAIDTSHQRQEPSLCRP